jgi:acetyl-CoA synthetase
MQRLSHIDQALVDQGFQSFGELYQWSVNQTDAFWAYTLERIGLPFQAFPDRVLERNEGGQWTWFPNGQFNAAAACLAMDSRAPALLALNEGEVHVRRLSYGALRDKVQALAQGLKEQGLEVGDPVAVLMPLNIEAVISFLAIAYAGMTAVCIAESFSKDVVHERLSASRAKLCITQNHFQRAGKKLPIYSKIAPACPCPLSVVSGAGCAPPELRPQDGHWADLQASPPEHPVEALDIHSPCTLLFSSGTTGVAKMIPWSHATTLKPASDAYYHLDLGPGDVLSMPTSLGWMMGPWSIFATLMKGASLGLYTGAVDHPSFGEFLEKAQVSVLGTVPGHVQGWERSGCLEGKDLGALRHFFSTGECSSPDAYPYLQGLCPQAPVLEYCGGTEIAGAYISSTPQHVNRLSRFTSLTLGTRAHLVAAVDQQGRGVLAKEGQVGELYLEPPILGLSEELWGAHSHEKEYFDGAPSGPEGQRLRRHGDCFRFEAGYYQHMGRADDCMNLGGVKLGCAELENVILKHPSIVACAALALPDEQGRDRLELCVQLEGEGCATALQDELQGLLKEKLNPLFKIYALHFMGAEDWPRTASGKLQRKVLRHRLLKASTV